MSLNRFLCLLFEHGHVQVAGFADINNADRVAASETLLQTEAAWRMNVPAGAPDFHPGAALWSAEQFFRCCQFAVQREIDIVAIDGALSGNCPDSGASAAHYSADLTLRFLPDLTDLIAGIASSDPLVAHLHALGRSFPLSSVGMKDVEDINIEVIAQDDCLMQMYVDRIVDRSAQERAENQAVQQWIQRSIGVHGALAGKISIPNEGDDSPKNQGHEQGELIHE